MVTLGGCDRLRKAFAEEGGPGGEVAFVDGFAPGGDGRDDAGGVEER